MSVDTKFLQGWIGQVRTCPDHLSKKGNVITPARDYVCVRVEAKITVDSTPTPWLEVGAVWLKRAGELESQEMCVTAGLWLTWPFKEVLNA